MDANLEEKLCMNCKRWITASNHLMHTVHCQRNIVLCESCDEPVPKSQLEDHKQVHVKISCEGCRKHLEKRHIDEHKTYDCPKRLTKCKFCELECAADFMDEHMEYCGSRTEECAKCGQFILLKEKAVHEQLACSPPADVTQEPSWREKYGSIHSAGSGDGFGDSPPSPGGFKRGRLDSVGAVMLPCEFCGEALPMEDLILHQSGCELHRENGLQDAEVLPLSPPPVREMAQGIVTVPCDGCGESVPEDRLGNHERTCERREQRSSEQPENAVQTHSTTAPSTNPIVSTRRVVLGHSESTESDVAMLPCEFCEQLYPEQNIVQHQAMCDSNPDLALPSDRLYPTGPQFYDIDGRRRRPIGRTASPPGPEMDLGLDSSFDLLLGGVDPLSVVESEMERMTHGFREAALRTSPQAWSAARRTQSSDPPDDVADDWRRAAPK